MPDSTCTNDPDDFQDTRLQPRPSPAIQASDRSLGDHWNEAAATVIALALPRPRGFSGERPVPNLRPRPAVPPEIWLSSGCGVFFAPASLVAFDRRDRTASGIVLSSFVSAQVGHIHAVVRDAGSSPEGLGQALLRASVSGWPKPAPSGSG